MRWLIVPGLVLFAVCLTGRSEDRPPKATPRPVYKNPLDVTVDDKGETARVILTGTQTVAVVDLASGRIKEEKPWPKDKRLPQPTDFVVHDLAKDTLPKDVSEKRRSPTTFDELEDLFGRMPGASNVRAVWVADSGGACVHQIPKSNIPATQVTQGWIFTNAVTVGAYVYHGGTAVVTVALDEPQQAFADPADIWIDRNHEKVYVLSAGANAFLVIDIGKLAAYHKTLPKDAESNGPITRYRTKEDLAASRHYVIAKHPTGANPRRLGLSKDGKTLVVSNYLGDSLTVIDAEKLKVLRHIPLGGPEPDAARRGEILFNSSKLTFQGQFTCASCHPNGGSDGLNWDLTRDGIGNPKNTKALWGVKDTGPYGWLGTSPNLEDRIRGTLRTLHRYEPSEEEVSDLAAYLATLEPPAPAAVKASERETVNRGKVIFETKARCSSCHSAPTFQDGKEHSIGTGTVPGEDRFNTPSLRAVSRTAPYLHDGRAATLEDMFKKRDPEQRHGAAQNLSAEELADLIAYLKSL